MLIFVSSTIRDLIEEREAVDEVIHQIRFDSFRSETFIASPETSRELCIRKASECDIFVGIYKNKYGDPPKEENPDGYSISEMEYHAARGKKIPQLIFEYQDAKERDDKLGEFLIKIKNFTHGNFIKKYKNVDDLKYNLLVSLVFEIFNLDKITQMLDNNSKSSLQKLVKDEINYKDYLHETCKFIDLRGFPSLNAIIKLDLGRLFISPKLRLLGNSLKVNAIQYEEDKYNNEITDESVEDYEINLHFPFHITDKNDPFILKRSDENSELAPNIMIEELIQQKSKIVLIGPPGIGKTSLLKNFILTMMDKNHLSIFPILFTLKDFGSLLSNDPNYSIISHLKDKFSNNGFGNSFIPMHLEAGSCILMCDGLDEVLDISLRKTVSKKLEEFSARYGKNNIIIVTSRSVGYNEAALVDFEHYSITKFSSEQIFEYIETWYSLNESLGMKVNEKKEKLKSNVKNDIRLRELAKTPLFLTLLCLVYENGNVPSKIIDLYERYLQLLLKTWDQNKNISKNLNYLSSNKIKKLCEDIAFWYYSNDRFKSTKFEIISFLKEDLKKTKMSDTIDDIDDAVDEILNVISERMGILLDSGSGEYSFLHISLLDYLASLKICQNEIPFIYDILFNNKNITRNYELIKFVTSILNGQLIIRSNEFIEYILAHRKEHEHMIHFNLVMIVDCMTEGITLDKAILSKITGEVQMILQHTDEYTTQHLHKSVAKLLSTSFEQDFIKMISALIDRNPQIPLNILIWTEQDLSKYEDIIKKCWPSVLVTNPAFLMDFLRIRLQKRDTSCIQLAKELILNKFEMHGENVLLTRLKNKFTMQVSPILKNRFEEEQHEKKRLEKERIAKEQKEKQTLLDFMNSRGIPSLNFGLAASYFSSLRSSLLNPAFNFRSSWEKYQKINYEQFSKIVLSFINSGPYILDPNLIQNKKRRLVILLYLISKEREDVAKYLTDLIENDDFELKLDLIKLYFIDNDGKLPEFVDDLMHRNNELLKDFESYEFVSKNCSSTQLDVALKEIIKASPLLCKLWTRIIRKYYSKIGTFLLDDLLESSIIHVESERLCSFYLVNLLHNYCRKGDVIVAGPLSGMVHDKLEKYTDSQKQVFDLIDCSCELNTEIHDDKEIMNLFDPEAFHRLRQIILDSNQMDLFRKLALGIYSEKSYDRDLLTSTINDRDLAYESARILLKNNEVELIRNKIYCGDSLRTNEKKLLLYDALHITF